MLCLCEVLDIRRIIEMIESEKNLLIFGCVLNCRIADRDKLNLHHGSRVHANFEILTSYPSLFCLVYVYSYLG